MIPIEYNLKSLLLRPAAAAAAIATLAVAVFVYACAHMLIHAVRASEGRTSDERVVVVTSKGSSGEITSRISQNEVRALDGYEALAPLSPLARGAAELVVTVRVGRTGSIRVRGVTPLSFALRQGVRVIAGRALAFGANEVLLGRVARRLLDEHHAVKDGELTLLEKQRFSVAGEMRSDNAAFDTEIWMDLQTLRAFFADASATSVYTATLASHTTLQALREQLAQDARVSVVASTEAEVYGARVQGLSLLLQGITGLVASVLVLGAFFGAVTCLFALVRSRSREIGTMKALGFERKHILLAYLVESLVVSLLAGAIGLSCAELMSFVRFEALSGGSGEMIGVSFEPTLEVVLSSLAVAAGLGFLGGYLPAIVASRVSPMEAIRGS